MQLNAKASAKFLREMKDSQQITSQRIIDLEKTVTKQQVALKILRTIVILILIAIVILVLMYKATQV
jgi:CHASE3 domain sensor protein